MDSFNASHNLCKIGHYEDLFSCLENVHSHLENSEQLDYRLLQVNYEKCDELLACILQSSGDSLPVKNLLHMLSSTFQWHTDMLNKLAEMVMKSGKRNTAYGKEMAKSDGNRNASAVKESESQSNRRQMVLDTVMTKKAISLKDVAGLEQAKLVLREAVLIPIKLPHVFIGTRKAWTKILLYGPPGTGKSRLVHAIVSEIDATFFNVSSADLLSSWLGESEKMIKELFCCAKEHNEYSVIFIDEIDSICRERTKTEDESTRRIKTELLQQIDRIDSGSENDKVVLLCATNCPWELDIAFLRRFQQRIYIPLPDCNARLEILLLHTEGHTSSFREEDWQVLAEKTEGYSGSDLATLSMNALYQPVRELLVTTSWAFTCDGIIRPSSSVTDDPNTMRFTNCEFQNLPPLKVVPRDVVLDDFLKLLQSSQRTVQTSELSKYEEFTEQFGQVG